MGEERGDEAAEGGLEDRRRVLEGPGVGGKMDEEGTPTAAEPGCGGRRDASPLPPRWVGELEREAGEEEVD